MVWLRRVFGWRGEAMREMRDEVRERWVRERDEGGGVRRLESGESGMRWSKGKKEEEWGF